MWLKKTLILIITLLLTSIASAALQISSDHSPSWNGTNENFTMSYYNASCQQNTTWWNSSSRGKVYAWDFNVNNTNVMELGGSNFNLSKTNNPRWLNICGISGNGCFLFGETSQDRFDILNLAYNQSSDNISILLRFNMNDSASSKRFLEFRSNNYATVHYDFFFSNIERLTMDWKNVSYNSQSAVTPFYMSANTDNFVTIIITKDFIDFYNNSDFLNKFRFNISSSIIPNISNISISWNSATFNGTIDDLKFFTYALTPQEISELYNATVANRAPRLLSQQTTTGDYWTANSVCAINSTTYQARQSSTVLITSGCPNSIGNSTPSAWVNMTLCLGTVQQNRTYQIYDTNYCGNLTNITITEFRNFSCVYCDNLMLNSTPEDIMNLSLCSVYDTMAQNRSYQRFDFNACGNVSNTTHIEIYNASCDFCSSVNYNLSSCNKDIKEELNMAPKFNEIMFALQFLGVLVIFIAKFYNVTQGSIAFDRKNIERNLSICLILLAVTYILSGLGIVIWFLDPTNQLLQMMLLLEGVLSSLITVFMIIESVQFGEAWVNKFASRSGNGR